MNEAIISRLEEALRGDPLAIAALGVPGFAPMDAQLPNGKRLIGARWLPKWFLVKQWNGRRVCINL